MNEPPDNETKHLIKNIKNEYRSNKRFGQILSLLSTSVIGIPLGVITNIIIAKFLGANSYGNFMFVINLFSISVLLGTFGLLHAGSRALVLTNDKQKSSQIFGAELVIVGFIYIVIVSSLFIYSAVDTNLEEKGVKWIFDYLVPFVWIFILINYFEILFQADNNIELLAKIRLYPKFGLFLAAVVIYFSMQGYSHDKEILIWGFYLTSQAVVFIYVLKKINLSLNNLKSRIIEIIDFNKSYGFDVYIGSIFSVGFSYFNVIFISYFGVDNLGVGYYALALMFAAPLAIIPNIIATVHYKDFSTQKRIPRKLVWATVGLSVVSLILIWSIVPIFVTVFYQDEFRPVIELNFIICIGVLFHGLADFINRFLGSHGEGKALRNSSFFVGISLFVLSIIFIPLWGATGAAYSKVMAAVVYITCMIWFYKRLAK